MSDSDSKPNAILTSKQRKLLVGDEELTSDQARAIKNRIRKRVATAVGDFVILFRYLEHAEIEKIFETEMEARASSGDTEEVAREVANTPSAKIQLPQMLAFLAWANDLDDAQVFPNEGADQPALHDFSMMAEIGLEEYFAKRKGMLADVTVSIELENLRPVEDLESDDASEISTKDINRMFATEWESPAMDEDDLEAAKEARRQYVRDKLDDAGGDDT
ncbi:hypothetical protein RBH20_09820 [Haloarcula sp. H-GB4]|uniref:hypothetical protein n=1 Tax=Haloarcula sp. H-GB4 TaxID=3069755 RepID=UPI0027B4FA4A|nr:hypothetical protein [Haloarcula sp. H-GB4]MDQ2072831.1 hypothetical protein [Haloarcula sp. H-GB4]